MNSLVDDIDGQKPEAGGDVITETKAGLEETAGEARRLPQQGRIVRPADRPQRISEAAAGAEEGKAAEAQRTQRVQGSLRSHFLQHL